MTVYAQVSRESRKRIRAYASDLQHDRRAIARNPEVPFLQMSYEYGTHIIMLFPADSGAWPHKGEATRHLFGTAKRDEIAAGAVATVSYLLHNHKPDRVTWLYCNGSTVRVVDPDYAGRIASQWRLDLLSAWSRIAA